MGAAGHLRATVTTLTQERSFDGHLGGAMTAFRLIPLPLHGVVEMLIGLMLMVAPFAVGFEPAAAVVAVVLGTAIVGVALSTAADARPGERGSLPIATHHAFDYGLALGLLGAAAVIGFDGDGPAAATLAAFGAAQLVLNLSTRYSARG